MDRSNHEGINIFSLKVLPHADHVGASNHQLQLRNAKRKHCYMFLPENLLSNEDFPNITLISHQAAKISYHAHCKVFQQLHLIVVEAKIKYIVSCEMDWI